MKAKYHISLFVSVLSFGIMNGQNPIPFNVSQVALGGEHQFNQNNIPCVGEVQRGRIDSITHAMSSQFRTKNGQQRMVTTFDWPMQKSTGAPYFDVWAISNYVDHNTGFPNQITDYNCGTRSYDTSSGYNHQGIDIYLWPFSWDMVSKDYAEVVAAAPGTIFYKNDGEPDQSCAFNNNNWNAIYIVHADGSYALYGHMKKNSLTSKVVGDAVQAGEFLGIVGSSGNSTGPHLHFEVFDSSDNLIDPFAGPCNTWNASSWWNTQMNYYEPNINAVMTHFAPPDFKACPQIKRWQRESPQYLESDFPKQLQFIFMVLHRIVQRSRNGRGLGFFLRSFLSGTGQIPRLSGGEFGDCGKSNGANRDLPEPLQRRNKGVRAK